MQHPSENAFDVQLVWQNIVRRPARWLLPAAAVAVLASAYAVVRQPPWEATQALVMRDEVAGRVMPPGQFASVDEMQTAQGTVLELARSPGVVEAALKQLRTAEGQPLPAAWPTQRDIEDVQSAINVKAPGGAEFGRTEVFYLVVQDANRDGAIRLNRALCGALESRLSQLRDAKAQSLIAELTETASLAKDDLAQATARLARLEAEVGADLGELRILNESASGESILRQSITQIQNELRQEKALLLSNEHLLDLLTHAQGDASRLVATPNRLLESQPALRRLKEGLVDAELRTSGALGLMSHEHPHVIAAVEEEKDVRRRLFAELEVAVRGVQAELQMNQRRIESLQVQLEDQRRHLGRIVGLRADYHHLTSEVRQRTEAWNKAQEDLSTAKARRAAAHSSSLLTRLDEPQTGARPAGASRSMIVLAGLFGGLLAGLGVVVLTAAPISPIAQPAAPADPSTPRADIAPSRPRTPARNLSLKDALLRIALGQPASAIG